MDHKFQLPRERSKRPVVELFKPPVVARICDLEHDAIAYRNSNNDNKNIKNNNDIWIISGT